MEKISAIGLMSGTSLDGLDIAHILFSKNEVGWAFEILETETVEYDSFWKDNLRKAPFISASNLRKLDVDLGHYFGDLVNAFIQKHSLNPLLVASHGHTVFHNPAERFTLQIGDGPALKSHIQSSLVYDFRSFDVALGGQGAPLVPIGDDLLFSEFDACINIGGFANISMLNNGKRIAFDIGAANIVLNAFAEKFGISFDQGGKIARKGKLQTELLNRLNNLPYFHQVSPKSLGREWVENEVFPLLSGYEPADILATFTQHIAMQIAAVIKMYKLTSVLFTGGGVLNEFLMELIEANSNAKCIIPDLKLIQNKEALIFAFLGVLRYQGEINVLSSVTGASRDSSSGSLLL